MLNILLVLDKPQKEMVGKRPLKKQRILHPKRIHRCHSIVVALTLVLKALPLEQWLEVGTL